MNSPESERMGRRGERSVALRRRRLVSVAIGRKLPGRTLKAGTRGDLPCFGADNQIPVKAAEPRSGAPAPRSPVRHFAEGVDAPFVSPRKYAAMSASSWPLSVGSLILAFCAWSSISRL